VNHEKLTRDQAAHVNAQVAPMLRHLNAMLRRMDSTGWEPNDRMRLAVMQAIEGVHTVSVLAHYQACGDKSGDALAGARQGGGER
jgi:hypothetical protein